MTMAVAPFFRRSLRLTARSGRTYLVRGGMLIVLLFIVFSTQATGAFFGAPGLRLFNSLSIFNAIIILLAGPFYFSSVISDEKEKMTLGLLKMTGMRPLAILLGTSGSQVLAAIGLLAVQVPFTVLSVTLGGIAMLQVWAAYAALMAHLVLVAGIGLFWSVVCRRTTRAAGMTTITLAAFMILPPVLSPLMGGLGWGGGPVSPVGRFVAAWTESLVFVRLSEVMSAAYSGGVFGFQFVADIALGLFCFGAAWLLFDAVTRSLASPSEARPLGILSLKLPRRLRPGRCWRAALVWKDFHFLGGGVTANVLKFLLLGLLLAGITIYMEAVGENLDLEMFGGMALTFALILGFVEAMSLSSRVFGSERKWGTLGSLALLPLSTRQIAWHKAVGCMFGLAPWVAWFVIGALACPEPIVDFLNYGLGEPITWFVMLNFVLFFHLAALFSLLLRRGGALLALVALWFASMFIGPFIMMLQMAGIDFGVLLASLGLVALIVVIHWATLKRLAHVAAQG